MRLFVVLLVLCAVGLTCGADANSAEASTAALQREIRDALSLLSLGWQAQQGWSLKSQEGPQQLLNSIDYLRSAKEKFTHLGETLSASHTQISENLAAARTHPEFPQEKIDFAEKAILQLNNTLEEIRRGQVDATHSLALSFRLTGDANSAITTVEEALQWVGNALDYAQLSMSLGDALVAAGKSHEAIKSYYNALRVTPCRTERWYPLIVAKKEVIESSRRVWREELDVLRSVEIFCHSPSQVKSGDLMMSKEEASNAVNNILYSTSFDMPMLPRQEGESMEDYITRSTAFPRRIIRGDWSRSANSMSNDVVTEDKLAANEALLAMQVEQKTPLRQADLWYAIAIAAESAASYQSGWEAILLANKLERVHRGAKYDRASAELNLENVRRIFSQDLLYSMSDSLAESSTLPVFIVGMMRSGSTLLETMLDAHSKIWGMGEDSLFNSHLGTLRDGIVERSENGDANSVVQFLLDHGDKIARDMNSVATIALNRSNPTKLENLHHVVDKMLFNYRNIGFIQLTYPDAVIINIVRDPLDVLVSCLKWKFDDTGLDFMLSIPALVHHYVLYLEYLHHFRTVLPDRILDIQYEQLVSNPEDTLRTIVEGYFGLDYEPQMLEFHKSQRPTQTNSQTQVRQPLYRSSIGSWRKYNTFLGTLKKELRKYLPALRQKGALPFLETTNWELDEDYDYSVWKRETHSEL